MDIKVCKKEYGNKWLMVHTHLAKKIPDKVLETG